MNIPPVKYRPIAEHEQNILMLFNSYDHGNIELAFQLCRGIGIDNLHNAVLKKLKCSNSYLCLTYFPSLMYDVRAVGMYKRNIKTLPSALWDLPKLSRLFLVGNNLNTLPPEIRHLTGLHQLTISNNQLTTLPPEIAQLSNLRALNLSRNNFTTLPKEVYQLPRLKSLNLYHNPISWNEMDRIHRRLPNCDIR